MKRAADLDTVQQARDLAAQRAAIAQYRAAARRNHEAGVTLLVAGFGDWASEAFEFSRWLGVTAIKEKLTDAS